MSEARKIFGPERVLQGNMDPMYLFADEGRIRHEVSKVVSTAGQGKHIMNVGHGVVQGTPEQNVDIFCDAARNCFYDSL